MSEPFLAEIRMAGFGYAPRNWALCNGQLLPISQNTALFSIIGTYYGGNGTSIFALPDLRGRAPMHQGQGPGLTDRVLGETGGETNVTLIATEMPAHTHAFQGEPTPGTSTQPAGNFLAQNRAITAFTPPDAPGLRTGPMAGAALGAAGGSLPHNNLQPYLAVTFIICLVGIYPSRN